MKSSVSPWSAMRSVPAFWVGLALFWGAGAWPLWHMGRDQSFLWLTQKHSPTTDTFLTYFTHLGDGLFAVFLVIFFWSRKKYLVSYCLLLAFAISGLLAQAGKFSFPQKRPYNHFESIGQPIHTIEGVTLMRSNNSFPSGHTATAFATAVVLVLMHGYWQRHSWLAIMLAISVGYTRIYLGNHFLSDVLGGSLLGVLGGLLAYSIAQRWVPAFIRKKLEIA